MVEKGDGNSEYIRCIYCATHLARLSERQTKCVAPLTRFVLNKSAVRPITAIYRNPFFLWVVIGF